MTECSICKTTESRIWLGCLGGWTLCDKCADDYNDFTNQVKNEQNIVILMEVYFRRGKGEDITYEQLHKEKSDFKFLTFKDLFKPKILEKT
jgi:dienelactone hydrolase